MQLCLLQAVYCNELAQPARHPIPAGYWHIYTALIMWTSFAFSVSSCELACLQMCLGYCPSTYASLVFAACHQYLKAIQISIMSSLTQLSRCSSSFSTLLSCHGRCSNTGQQRFYCWYHAATTVLMSQETYEYWQQCLEGIDKPAAKKLIRNLDMTNPLGIKHSLGQRRGAKYSKAPLYPFFLSVKKDHPTKVLLVRVSLLPSKP